MWLGSGAMRWPVDWTYVEWGIALVCGVVIIPLVGLVAAFILGPLGGIVWGVGLGGWLSYRAFDRVRVLVDADRPVRWWRLMIHNELRTGRRVVRGTQSMQLVATWIEPVSAERRAELTSRRRLRRRAARRELARGVPARLGAR
jgi:hypothetical protein